MSIIPNTVQVMDIDTVDVSSGDTAVVVLLEQEVEVITTLDQGPPGPVGPSGPASTVPGPPGPQGTSVLYGVTPPTTAVGHDGDFYINTATNFLYGPKATNVWPAGVSLIGPVGPMGPQGNTVLYGLVDPVAGQGINGDFYINTITHYIFGPKAAGAWPAGTSLVGSIGPQGPQGIQGVKGDKGDQGIQGPVGPVPEAPTDGKVYGRQSSGWIETTSGASSASPLMNGVATVGVSTKFTREDHVHPTDTSRYAASNPSGYQTAAQVAAVLPLPTTVAPIMDGAAAVGVGVKYAREDHAHPSDTSRLAKVGDIMTGPLNVNMAVFPRVNLSATAANGGGGYTLNVLGNATWSVEQTGDANANLTINRFNNSGTYVGAVLIADRATGNVAISNTLAVNSITSNSSVSAGISGVTGTYYFGNTGTKWLAYDGTSYTLNGGAFVINGTTYIAGNVVSQPNATSGTYYFGTSGTKYLTYDGTNFTLGGGQLICGALTASGNLQLASASPQFNFNSNAGSNYRQMNFLTNGVARWTFYVDDVAESGGNAGSNFGMNASSDGGGYLSTPFKIIRSTGVAIFAQPIVNGSDARLKTDIEPVTEALAIVEKLQGVYYRHKDIPQRQVGFIAQAVLPTLPEVVFKTGQPLDAEGRAINSEEPLLGLAYPNMVAVLVEAVKELAARVAALEGAA